MNQRAGRGRGRHRPLRADEKYPLPRAMPADRGVLEIDRLSPRLSTCDPAWNAAAERMFGDIPRTGHRTDDHDDHPFGLAHRRVRDSGGAFARRATLTIMNCPRHEGRRTDRCLLTISPLRAAGQDCRTLEDCSRHHEGQAGQVPALRQSEQRAGTRGGRRRVAPVISTGLVFERRRTPCTRRLGAAMESMASDFASVQTLSAGHRRH